MLLLNELVFWMWAVITAFILAVCIWLWVRAHTVDPSYSPVDELDRIVHREMRRYNRAAMRRGKVRKKQ